MRKLPIAIITILLFSVAFAAQCSDFASDARDAEDAGEPETAAGLYASAANCYKDEGDASKCADNYEAAAAIYLGLDEDMLAAESYSNAATCVEFADRKACGEDAYEAAKLYDNGTTSLEGELPVNTDGGFMANGLVLGASDIAQVVENVLQLRGEAGDRQVKKENIKYALSAMGASGGSGFCGGIAGRGFGTGGGYGVTILEKF